MPSDAADGAFSTQYMIMLVFAVLLCSFIVAIEVFKLEIRCRPQPDQAAEAVSIVSKVAAVYSSLAAPESVKPGASSDDASGRPDRPYSKL